MAKLSDAEVEKLLPERPGWTVQNAKLHREFKFPDFAHAVGFMVTCAPGIEKMNHHPEWSNVYNRVNVDLTTHDSGGITKKDFELAALLDSIAKKLA